MYACIHTPIKGQGSSCYLTSCQVHWELRETYKDLLFPLVAIQYSTRAGGSEDNLIQQVCADGINTFSKQSSLSHLLKPYANSGSTVNE